MHDEPRDRRGTVPEDSALREGIAVGPLAFDRERWTAGADGRAAGHPPRMRAAWMVGAAAVAAVAVTAPGWLNTARIPAPVQPGVVAPALSAARAHVGLEPVWMTSPRRGWALGFPSAIGSTTDGGHRWQNVSPPRAPALGALAVPSPAMPGGRRPVARASASTIPRNGGRSWIWIRLVGPAFPAGWRLSRHALALGRPGTAYLLVKVDPVVKTTDRLIVVPLCLLSGSN